MGKTAMIKVASDGGNAQLLHIKVAVTHRAPRHAVMHHGGRQHRGKMVSTIVMCSCRIIVNVITTMIMMVMNDGCDDLHL